MDTTVVKNAKDGLNGMSKAANQAADEISDKVKAGANQVVKRAQEVESEWSDKFADKYDDLKDQAGKGYETSIDFVKKYPLYSLLGATVIGFAAGALIRRSR